MTYQKELKDHMGFCRNPYLEIKEVIWSDNFQFEKGDTLYKL